MGCCPERYYLFNGEKDITSPPKGKKNDNYFKAYKTIKSLITSFKNNKIDNLYLISTESINNFIQLIKQYKVFRNSKEETRLKKSLYNYELEQNIKIYYDLEECQKLITQNNENNEFIIVNEEFNKYMNIKYNENMSVEVDKTNWKIIFNSKEEKISFKENEIGFYQFVENEKKKKKK